MRVSTDALIAALLDQRLKLTGDADGGVSLYCRDCKGHPIAHYGHLEGDYRDPKVAYVLTIPSLWAVAVEHLDDEHRNGTAQPPNTATEMPPVSSR
ncbi:hypothetical protein ACIBQX_11385 [Nonomuraea sp. NPDC049714]|uniref:hypothetical protein n=1 Tax=Nonomuraea sp. NPDC049714 TaxID=3364357 RepID=UPI00379DEC1C